MAEATISGREALTPVIPFRYIVVEGPIGVGKTTLARRLSVAFGAQLLLEAPVDNPFLADFYENPEAFAFSAQLSFLLQRAHQMHQLRQSDLFHAGCVADFMLDKDRLFAALNLGPAELALYEQVYARVIDQVPEPDLVIYLHAPVSVLQARIAKRGIGYEQSIDDAYLERLAHAYVQHFRQVSPRTRLLVVDAESADFVDRHDHFETLVETLGTLTSGVYHLELASFG